MSAAHRLNVFDKDAHGSPCQQVWLDCEDMDFTGICLGSGETREEALVQAKLELEHALRQVDRHIARVQQGRGESRSQWEGGSSPQGDGNSTDWEGEGAS